MGFLMGFWSGKLPSEWLLNPLSFAWNFRGGVVEAINFTDMTRTTRPGACNFCSKGPPFSTPSTKESNSAKRMGPLCTWRQASSKFLPKAEHLVPETETNSKILLLKIIAWKMKFPFGSGPMFRRYVSFGESKTSCLGILYVFSCPFVIRHIFIRQKLVSENLRFLECSWNWEPGNIEPWIHQFVCLEIFGAPKYSTFDRTIHHHHHHHHGHHLD